MTVNPFKFKIARPKNKESQNDLDTFNEMLSEISSDIIIDQSDTDSLTYYITIKSKDEEIKLLDFISKKPNLGHDFL
jgi:hypothetical protein